MTHKIEKLEEILRDQFGFNHGGLNSFSTDTGVAFDSFNQPPPLITSEGQSKYDSEQIKSFFERDFLLRLFITNTNITGKTVFLRTKFGDNHPHASHLNPVRDFLKATNAEHYTAAKTNCTELISTCLYAFSEKSTSSASKYYSFAVTMASGLSNFGSNTDFEFHPNLVKSKDDVDMARKKMCLLMHIIFSKISMYRFLVNEEGSNTYRIAYCRTKESKTKQPFVYAAFSFCLQVCLTAYVVAANIEDASSFQLDKLPLAILTLVYGFIIASPGVMDSAAAFRFYGKKISLLMLMDFFVNQVAALVLVISGFFVILVQENYIDAVLNTAALLFIPEIDDNLPSLLGLDENNIIENYIVSESLKQFDRLVSIKDEDIEKKLLSIGAGVDFQDYYLTNIKESPSQPNVGAIFEPYQIRASATGHQIDPSNFVTEDCLIREIEWAYTNSQKYGNTTSPRIAYLRIVKICDGDDSSESNEVVIKRKDTHGEGIITSDVKHVLRGCFVITTFQMSNDIIRLRVCGSKSAKDFQKAFEYYSLWEITTSAQGALEKEARRCRRLKMKAQKSGSKEPKSFEYVNMV